MTYIDELVIRIEKAAIERGLGDDNGFLRALLEDAGKTLSDCARSMQWHDMSTAPKDGTTVLIWEPSGFMMPAYWGIDDQPSERWLSGMSKHAASGAFLHCVISVDSPTRWMPLPGEPR